MEYTTAPTLYIIAGCNGAGKTTASYSVLPDLLKCREFVNADETLATRSYAGLVARAKQGWVQSSFGSHRPKWR